MLTKCGSEDKLKQVIELKHKLLQAKEKFEELKIVSSIKKSPDSATARLPSPKGKSVASKNAPVKFSMEISSKKKDTSSTSCDPTSMEAQLSIMRKKQKQLGNLCVCVCVCVSVCVCVCVCITCACSHVHYMLVDQQWS